MSTKSNSENQLLASRWLIILTKIIPMVVSFIYLIYVAGVCLDVDVTICNYLGGSSLLMVIFMYLASYALRFCNYHRMFIHYILVCNILGILNEYTTILSTGEKELTLFLVFTGIFLFIVIYMKSKC